MEVQLGAATKVEFEDCDGSAIFSRSRGAGLEADFEKVLPRGAVLQSASFEASVLLICCAI